MCGIAGYFGPGELDATRVLELLRHRGPDASASWTTRLNSGERLQLLHTRLRILDLSDAGAQPMGLVAEATGARGSGQELRTAGPVELVACPGPPSNFQLPTSTAAAHAAVVLSFNGEIYNYRELRAELAGLGHVFRSSGDTEVLLRGYAEWGEGVFAKLDGMFAVAIFDAAQQRLVLARDHAGIKPLYTLRTPDGGFAFASEVRALAGSGFDCGEVDRGSVADFLRFGSMQEPRTLWSGIRAFPPGHWGFVRLDAGCPAPLQLRPYWLPERFEPATTFGTDWRGEHDALLADTVEHQLAADVPLGVYLSGGIDSTLLLELAAARGNPAQLTAFTLAGAATDADEAEIAAATARRAGVKHVAVAPEVAELERWVRDALLALDQPSSDGINTYLISRASRAAGLVVALGGTGADELHGVYGRSRSLARLLRGWRASGPLRGFAARVAVVAAGARGGAIEAERLRELLAAAPSPWRMTLERRRFFTNSQVDAFWPDSRELRADPVAPLVDPESLQHHGVEEQVRLTELRGYLVNTLLRDADGATMANHQELRVPYLGRRYIECVLRAPETVTEAQAGVKKPCLSALLSPGARQSTSQPKRGFLVNYVPLLLGPLREEFVAATERLNATLGFRLDAPALLAEQARTRDGKFSRRLWSLLSLGIALQTSRRD